MPAKGKFVIRDTAGRFLREEPAPRSLISYELSRRKLATFYREINEIMKGPNPFTQVELRRLLGKEV